MPFYRLHQRRLFARHIRFARQRHLYIEVECGVQDVLPKQSVLIRLLYGALRAAYRPIVSVPNEHEPVSSAGGIARDAHTLKQRVRIAFQNALIVVCARIALFAVAKDILGRIGAHHKAPLHAGGKRRAAPAAQPRVRNLFDYLFRLHLKQRSMQPRIAAVGDVLHDVGGRGNAGVSQRNPMLHLDARQFGEVRDAVYRRIAQIPQQFGARQPIIHQHIPDNARHVVRRDIAEEQARTARLLYIHQRFGVADT